MLRIEQGQHYECDAEEQLPYEHVKNLGFGNSGTVEKVKDKHTNEVYARKTIWIPRGRGRHRQERSSVFENEVKIIRNLGTHNHIISVYATYMTKRSFGIILHPVASEGDLEGVLSDYWKASGDEKNGTVTRDHLDTLTATLERSFGCLAAGLAFIHAKRVRHKDIKPRNILVHKGMVLYTDFGYSLDSSGLTHSTTEGKPDFFTRRYCAPEVLEHENRNSKTDIYSLGCVYIDIFSAITQAIEYDEEKLFSHIMMDIHIAIDYFGTSERYSFLGGLIKEMTSTDRMQRPSAQELVRGFYSKLSFMCEECLIDTSNQNTDTSNSIDQTSSSDGTSTPWIGSPTYQQRSSHLPLATRSFVGDFTPSMGFQVWISQQGYNYDDYPPACNDRQPVAYLPRKVQRRIGFRERRYIQTGRSQDVDETLDTREILLPESTSALTTTGFRRVAIKHHEAFFTLGRVFKMLWTELPVLLNPPEQGSSSTRHSTELLNGTAFSEIRYFLVVSNKGTFSLCIPIHTYGKRGATKPGLAVADHGIIHTTPEPPHPLVGEHITKYSIRVEANLNESLHPESRVDYGRAYAVEHNVKVLDIGIVTKGHQYIISEYFHVATRGE